MPGAVFGDAGGLAAETPRPLRGGESRCATSSDHPVIVFKRVFLENFNKWGRDLYAMEKLHVRAVIEVAGKPAEYVEKTIKMVVDSLKQEKGMIVTKEKTHPAAEHEKMFSTFAEVEVAIDDFDRLMHFCFHYLPSSIEFVEPEQIVLELNEATEGFNDLLGRLHQTDLMVKDFKVANDILEKNANALLKTSITLALKDGEKDLVHLSKIVGIKDEDLKLFMDQYIKEHIFLKTEEKYSLKHGSRRT